MLCVPSRACTACYFLEAFPQTRHARSEAVHETELTSIRKGIGNSSALTSEYDAAPGKPPSSCAGRLGVAIAHRVLGGGGGATDSAWPWSTPSEREKGVVGQQDWLGLVDVGLMGSPRRCILSRIEFLLVKLQFRSHFIVKVLIYIVFKLIFLFCTG